MGSTPTFINHVLTKQATCKIHTYSPSLVNGHNSLRLPNALGKSLKQNKIYRCCIYIQA